MIRTVTWTALLGVLCALPAAADNSLRMWYRGPFEGWVDLKSSPAYGYYYHPSPSSAYPLNETASGKPIPCEKCGHAHYPGETTCPYCGCVCRAGGNGEAKSTVYTPSRLPGYYYYEEQPHYRFVSPMRLGGTYLKYTRPYD